MKSTPHMMQCISVLLRERKEYTTRLITLNCMVRFHKTCNISKVIPRGPISFQIRNVRSKCYSKGPDKTICELSINGLSVNNEEMYIELQVKERSEKLKRGVNQQHTSSKRKFEESVNSLKNKVRKMEEEAVLARQILQSNSEVQIQQYSQNSSLVAFTPVVDNSEGLETWTAPNLLFQSNLVVDKEIEQHLSPIMGSLCTIQKESILGRDEYDVPPIFEADMSKPVFPFARRKASKAVHAGRVFRWKSPTSFSGKIS